MTGPGNDAATTMMMTGPEAVAATTTRTTIAPAARAMTTITMTTGRGGRAQEERHGCGVIVAIVLGSIVLLGRFGVESTRSSAGGKAPVPTGWVEYKSDSDKFKALFPLPAHRAKNHAHRAGWLVERRVGHRAHDGPERRFIPIAGVIVLKFKSGTSPSDRDKAMDGLYKDFPTENNLQVSKPRFSRWVGKKAKEVGIGNMDESGKVANGKKRPRRVRYFTTETHAYIAFFGTVGSGTPKQEDS